MVFFQIKFFFQSTTLMTNNNSGVQITSEKNITSQIEMERLIKGRVISEIFKVFWSFYFSVCKHVNVIGYNYPSLT
jgi:hypothetical protein